MIITNILGGLGNQMFQYAAGRALSLRANAEYRLEISEFNNYSLHQGFELHRVFNCPVKIATTLDVKAILGWQSSPTVRRIISKFHLQKLRHKAWIVEPTFNYWTGLADAPRDCCMYGYWQSEKYFLDKADAIRSDFTFIEPPKGRNLELASQIEDTNSVGLHIRRGDYISDSETNAILGSCSLDYYYLALEHIANRVDSPFVFVFSDDIKWAKENLKLNFPSVFISHNKKQYSYIDMQLMSLCRHNIIANSSFSWWAAWLNSNIDKIIVAPRKWFSGPINVDDLLPRSWVIL